MKKPAALLMLFAACANAVAMPRSAMPSQQAIDAAIRQTLAETPEHPVHEDKANTLGTERERRFAKEFDEAKIPSCLGPDGLDKQPTGPLAGLLAAPFVLVAKLRGKCN